MKVPRSELAKVIGKRTLNVRDSHVLAKQIAAYLLEENRIGELESLIRDVMAYRESQGIVEANVHTAHDLEPNILQELRKLIRHRYPQAVSVSVSEEHDQDVIGGFRLRTAHSQLDMSVRARLDTFRRLTEGIN